MSVSLPAPVKVRRAAAADCEAVATVHVHSWQWAYRGLVADATLDALRVEERLPEWREHLGPSSVNHVWLAEAGGQGLGFAGWGPSRDPDAEAGTAELYGLYLEPFAAGSGVAAALLEAACREMREEGHARALLWVLAQNPRARRFYERHGWTVDGARRHVDLRGSVLEALRYRTVLGA